MAPPTNVGSIDLTSTGVNLHSQHVFNVLMTYDGTTLKVTITDTTTNVSASESYTVNIPGIIGGSTGYVGFTGGTGGLTAMQSILNWIYTPSTPAPTLPRDFRRRRPAAKSPSLGQHPRERRVTTFIAAQQAGARA